MQVIKRQFAADIKKTVTPELSSEKVKLEITIKISSIPNFQQVEQGKVKVIIPAIKSVEFYMKKKTWNKFVNKTKEFDNWIGVANGKIIGIDQTIKLEGVGFQVFEKKKKETE